MTELCFTMDVCENVPVEKPLPPQTILKFESEAFQPWLYSPGRISTLKEYRTVPQCSWFASRVVSSAIGSAIGMIILHLTGAITINSWVVK